MMGISAIPITWRQMLRRPEELLAALDHPASRASTTRRLAGASAASLVIASILLSGALPLVVPLSRATILLVASQSIGLATLISGFAVIVSGGGFPVKPMQGLAFWLAWSQIYLAPQIMIVLALLYGVQATGNWPTLALPAVILLLCFLGIWLGTLAAIQICARRPDTPSADARWWFVAAFPAVSALALAAAANNPAWLLAIPASAGAALAQLRPLRWGWNAWRSARIAARSQRCAEPAGLIRAHPAHDDQLGLLPTPGVAPLLHAVQARDCAAAGVWLLNLAAHPTQAWSLRRFILRSGNAASTHELLFWLSLRSDPRARRFLAYCAEARHQGAERCRAYLDFSSAPGVVEWNAALKRHGERLERELAEVNPPLALLLGYARLSFRANRWDTIKPRLLALAVPSQWGAETMRASLLDLARDLHDSPADARRATRLAGLRRDPDGSAGWTDRLLRLVAECVAALDAAERRRNAADDL